MIDITEIRSLVQPDGSDFEVERFEDGAVYLTLLMEDASCAECVMPKEILESMTLAILKRSSPEVQRVVIADPRA